MKILAIIFVILNIYVWVSLFVSHIISLIRKKPFDDKVATWIVYLPSMVLTMIPLAVIHLFKNKHN